MHCCACSTVSTTRLLSCPQAVEIAISYFSSIAPRLPRRPYARVIVDKNETVVRNIHESPGSGHGS